jgi:hypothetical protein
LILKEEGKENTVACYIRVTWLQSSPARAERNVPFTMVRPNTGMMEEKPVVDFDGLWRALGVGDAMVSVVCVNQVLHDGPRFEQPNSAAVGVGRLSALGGDRWG